MKKTRKQKPYWEMSARELAEATKEYDREIPDEMMQPLTKEERSRWEATKREPSRSIYILSGNRKKTEPVLVELDGKLVREMDLHARVRKASAESNSSSAEFAVALAVFGGTNVIKPSRKSA